MTVGKRTFVLGSMHGHNPSDLKALNPHLDVVPCSWVGGTTGHRIRCWRWTAAMPRWTASRRWSFSGSGHHMSPTYPSEGPAAERTIRTCKRRLLYPAAAAQLRVLASGSRAWRGLLGGFLKRMSLPRLCGGRGHHSRQRPACLAGAVVRAGARYYISAAARVRLCLWPEVSGTAQGATSNDRYLLAVSKYLSATLQSEPADWRQAGQNSQPMVVHCSQ